RTSAGSSAHPGSRARCFDATGLERGKPSLWTSARADCGGPADGAFQRHAAQAFEQQRCGELDVARRTFTNVLKVAREMHDAEVHAHAALGLHGLGYTLASEAGPIDRLDDAFRELESVGLAASSLAARLLAARS